MAKCCVCGNEYEDVIEIENLTKEKRTYCQKCLDSGIQPYEDLVNFGWIFELFSKTYRQRVIIPTLQYNGKTVQQFDDEVREKRGW